MKKVLHLCPRNSLFSGKVEKFANLNAEKFFLYETDFNFYSKIELIQIFKILRRHKDHFFVFHRVPSWAIGVLVFFFFPRLQYSLFYWGDDYYLPILNPERLRKHCVRKSPYRALIEAADASLDSRQPRRLSLRKKIKAYVRLRIASCAASQAQCIYASPKQYRYLRYVSYKLRGVSAFCPENQQMTMYPDVESDNKVHERKSAHLEAQGIFSKKSLTVLVCHSGTSEVNVPHSLALLEQMASHRRCEIHIVGYLSYAGGDDASRDLLEKNYVAQASKFAKSVRFERKFLTVEQLNQSFEGLDLAFFSAYRDEGLTLLNMLARRGVPLCFNRFSINYDYFKARAYGALLTHEEAVG